VSNLENASSARQNRTRRPSKRQFYFAEPDIPPGCSPKQLIDLTRARLNTAVDKFFRSNPQRQHLAATVHGDFGHPWWEPGERLLLARSGREWGGYGRGYWSRKVRLFLVSAEPEMLSFYAEPRDEDTSHFVYRELAGQAGYAALLGSEDGGGFTVDAQALSHAVTCSLDWRHGI
jgi:hypothetical protein